MVIITGFVVLAVVMAVLMVGFWQWQKAIDSKRGYNHADQMEALRDWTWRKQQAKLWGLPIPEYKDPIVLRKEKDNQVLQARYRAALKRNGY